MMSVLPGTAPSDLIFVVRGKLRGGFQVLHHDISAAEIELGVEYQSFDR